MRSNRCAWRKTFVRCTLLAALAATAGAHAQDRAVSSPGVDDAALVGAPRTPDTWLTYGRDYAETRFSPLAQVDAGNVARLGLAWTYDTGAVRGLEATPLVANGVLYASTSWSDVFALDATTGRQLWKWDARADRVRGARACCDVVNRGVALYDGKVYVSVIDGRLAALDAATGKTVWDVQTTPLEEPYTITGAPRVVDGKVIIGNGGAELGVRGFFSAYDAATGALVWRFYTVPGDPSKPFESPALEAAAKTWTGEWWTMGGGGTAWDAFAYDAEAKLLYVGTGNGSPWDRSIRSPGGGDNLYLSSILALNVRDRRPRLALPDDARRQLGLHGRAATHARRARASTAASARSSCRRRRTASSTCSIDSRASCCPPSRSPHHVGVGVDLRTGRPIETPHARYTDAAHDDRAGPRRRAQLAADVVQPATGLVYIPVSESTFIYGRDLGFTFRPAFWNLGVDLAASTGVGRTGPVRAASEYSGGTGEAVGAPSSLLAWDPVARRARWRVAALGGDWRRHFDDGRKPRLPGHGLRLPCRRTAPIAARKSGR